MLIITHSLML